MSSPSIDLPSAPRADSDTEAVSTCQSLTAQHTDDLTGFNREVDSLEYLEIAKGFVQIPNIDWWVIGPSPPIVQDAAPGRSTAG